VADGTGTFTFTYAQDSTIVATVDLVVGEHPRLTRDAVLAAIEFAAAALRANVVYPVPGHAA
jgi:hypothetical protein